MRESSISIQSLFDLDHFAIPPVIAHLFDHLFCLHPMFTRFVLVRLRQLEARIFQMAIGKVQAHLTTFSDTVRGAVATWWPRKELLSPAPGRYRSPYCSAACSNVAGFDLASETRISFSLLVKQ